MTRSLDPDWSDPRRDTTARSALMVQTQASAVIIDETCPGTCEWVDSAEVRLPGSNGSYGPKKLSQDCTSCGRERVVAPADHPHHAEIIAELGLSRRINALPAMLHRFIRGD